MNTQTAPETILIFAGYRLDVGSRRLLAPDGTPVSLSSRAFDTLHYLASHPRELVGKNRLMQAVWPTSVVEDNNLNQQISAVRKALGDSVDNPRFIVTDARRGFRFIQDVQKLDSHAPAPGNDVVELGPQAATQAVRDGVSPTGQGAPMGSKRRLLWRPIAIAASTLVVLGAALCSAPFERESKNQPRTAATTGGAHNLEAYQAYLSARAVTNTVGFSEARESIRLLERSVELDPSFAPAWAALAEAYSFAADFPDSLTLPLTQVELQQRMLRAALRALELAPDAPDSLRGAGMVSMRNRDWADAERRLRRAVELAGADDYESNLLLAWFLMNVGRVSEAVPYAERAIAAEPLLLRPVTLRAALHEMRGENDAAAALLLASEHLRGQEILRRQEMIMLCLARGAPGSMVHVSTRSDGATGCPSPTLQQLRDRYQQALASGSPGQLLPVVLLASHLGDPGLAMDALRAIGPTTQNLFAVWRPALSDVRGLPEFQKFVRDVGLVDYWKATGHWGEFCRQSDSGDLVCR